MRIVFMGTPDFAVESLRQMIENHYDVAGVVTTPDKPAGRGHHLQFSPVKRFALERGLPLLQPERLKDEAFLEQLRSLQADVQVVVAFRMLPELVWAMPQCGTFNLHASLLPQYRGAAPINRAIMNGEKETGVTTFFLTHEIDTGKIILQEKIPISPDDNAGTLHDRLMMAGAETVCKTLKMIEKGDVPTIEQSSLILPDETLKPAPKLFRENCCISTQMTVYQAHNFVRGLSPLPAAWAEVCWHEGGTKEIVKIYETEPILEKHNLPAGTMLTDGKRFAKIALIDGFLMLKSVQMAGKRRMDIADLLRGLRS